MQRQGLGYDFGQIGQNSRQPEGAMNTDTTWPLQAAKDQLSQLVKAAAAKPQTVTVHGKRAAMVLSPQAYDRLTGRSQQRLSADLLQPGLAGQAADDLFTRDRKADRRAVKL